MTPASFFVVLPLLAVQAAASAVYPHFRGAAAAVVVPDVHGSAVQLVRATRAGDAPPADLTAPPLIPEGLVRARSASFSVPGCATACIESAISDDTTCAVTDVACGCSYANGLVISSAAADCVESACGYLTAFYAWSTLESLCEAYSLSSLYTNTYSLSYATATASGATTDATAVASRSRTTVTTATRTSSPAASSSSSGGGRPSSGDNSDSTTSPTSSSSSGSLSKAAIAGIAVGAAGGAVLLCALFFLIYRCTSRNSSGAASAAAGPSTQSVPPAAPSGLPAPTVVSVSPPSAVAVPAGQPELDGKTVAAKVAPMPQAPSQTTQPQPAALSVSPVSPNSTGQGPPPAYLQWPQQQQQQQPYLVQGYSISPGQPPQAQTVVAPAGYAAACPAGPLPGVLYQEAPDGTPASHFPQEVPATPMVPAAARLPHELTGQPYNGGTYEMPGGNFGSSRPHPA